jgi:TRAP-type C4-dicarboxylate transport system permease large subunit
VLPFVGLMMLAVVVLCVFPELSLAMPDWVMGK